MLQITGLYIASSKSITGSPSLDTEKLLRDDYLLGGKQIIS